MMAVMVPQWWGAMIRVNECRQGIGSLPVCSHPWSLPQSHVILRKGPPTCETWGGCARLGSCHLSGSTGTPHATHTVLPAVTPLSPPRLAAGLSSLSQGQVQSVLGCVQPHPTALLEREG